MEGVGWARQPVRVLAAELRARQLRVRGAKAELVARLERAERGALRRDDRARVFAAGKDADFNEEAALSEEALSDEEEEEEEEEEEGVSAEEKGKEEKRTSTLTKKKLQGLRTVTPLKKDARPAPTPTPARGAGRGRRAEGKEKEEEEETATTVATAVLEMNALKERQAAELERLSLLWTPGVVLWHFLRFVAGHGHMWGTYLAQRALSVIFVASTAVFLGWLYQIESNREVFRPAEELVLWYGGWVCLGFLSSFGVGTGLHTFLLYLGPFIARAAMVADECGHANVQLEPMGVPWIVTYKMVCAGDPQEHPPLDLAWFLAVVGLVRLPAFAWGLGTAIGELPPFFAARAARLAGEEDEGHLDVMKLAEKADRDGLATLLFSDRAMVVSYRMMRHLGFWGIMLLASIPNPLFDLAGAFSGYMLVPFQTFFAATAVGKAVNKVTLQSLFVVALFTGGKKSILRRVLDTATFLPVAARDSLTAYMDQQRAQFDPNAPHDASTVVKGWLGMIFDLVLVTMLAFCFVSIVQSLAHAQVKRDHDAERTRLRHRHPAATTTATTAAAPKPKVHAA